MEARFFTPALVVASLLSLGASHRTQHFIVTAPTPELARQIGESAEAYRRDLAIEWLGHELPPWQGPCPITAQVGPHLGAGGATSFMFAQGRPFGWQMTIQGSRERLLDSVLPHEITHTIFATHFGRPLPRWADEGACTTVEHISEKTKQQRLLINFLTTGRGIAFNRMFAMKEYPPDILPLYSQGYSLARYLIAQGGKRKFIEYVGDGMDWNNWTAATKKHYGIESLSDLQVAWLDWVRRGSPPLASQGTQIAQADPRQVGQPAADSTQPAAPAAPSAVPEVNTVASVAQPFDSWYARQRDAARQETGSPVAAAAPRPEADATGTEQPQTEPAVYSSATRPQPIGTPEPTVIQWTAEPTPSYGAPASVAPPPLVAIPLQSTLPQRY